jgi:hypothetical protein
MELRHRKIPIRGQFEMVRSFDQIPLKTATVVKTYGAAEPEQVMGCPIQGAGSFSDITSEVDRIDCGSKITESNLEATKKKPKLGVNSPS